MLWTLAAPSFGQPLERGVESADGQHFLVDGETIRSVSKDFRDETHQLDAKSVEKLFQGTKSWGDSFLVKTASGLARVTTTQPALELKTIISKEDLQIEEWGNSFLAYAPGETEIAILAADTELNQPLKGSLGKVVVVGPSLVLLQTDQGFFVLSQESGKPSLSEIALPFDLKEANVASGAGRAILWSPKSETLVNLIEKDSDDPGHRQHTNQTISLDQTPTYGVRILEGRWAVAGGPARLTLLSPSGKTSNRPRPTVLEETSFANWPMFVTDDGHLQLFLETKERTQVVHLQNRSASNDILPEGKLHSLVLPEPGQSGQALLFWNTSREEPKIDEDGKKVIDPATGQPAAPLNVSGHMVFALEESGRWAQVAHDPRARLVGPIQRVGERVVYATQTEPEHFEGKELELNSRFPYPPVILHGRSVRAPRESWSYEKPRGETPSKDRLPESAWPLLEENGPLLLTSEGDNLLAIDPGKGELLWSTPELPIDDSSPLMLRWSDGFALQATKSTGRALLVIDPKQGQLVSSVRLNEFFFWEKWRHLLGVTIVCAALAYYIYAAGKRNLYIRKIAGLQALDEAVGRATEMGKPVLYVVGLADVDDIQTMASLSILSHVARKTAEYDTPIITTTARAVAFSAAQEIVRDAFSIAGRPDAFSVESVRYISDDQFGYTAGVDGIMVREKPAANFYIGNFYAESLILAETGYATGSIQIAGTAQPSQVPFFVAACDYTLIGEELFAASAYLSRDPLQVGSLRGQDVGKAIVMVLLVVCSLLVSFGVDWAKLSEWTGWNLP